MQAPPQTLASLCAQKDMPVADALMKATGGCGPAVCREVAFRAFGTEEVYAAAMTEAQRTALAARLEELADRVARQRHAHCCGERRGQARRILFCAPAPVWRYMLACAL